MSLFRRRQARGVFPKIKESLWPSMGWGRTFDYYRHRIFRTGDSSYKISAGLAVGVAISFSPFLGTHILQALFFAWLLRASIIASVVGTLAGNPWTFPFIFWAAYHSGVWICGLFGLSDFLELPGAEYWSDQSFGFLLHMFDYPFKLLLPLAVGGYVIALLLWPLLYGMLYYPVYFWRRAYHHARWRYHHKKSMKEPDKKGES